MEKYTPTHIRILTTSLSTYPFIIYYLIGGHTIHPIFAWPSSATNNNAFKLILFAYDNWMSSNVFFKYLYTFSLNTP